MLTPILLLASVKVGFIDRLRQEFIEDPSFREIRPAEADLRSEDLFDEIRGWEGVRYVMPSIMLVPREVDYVAASGGAKDQARLLPSDASDPLYDKLDGAPADGDTVVVTADIAETAGLRIGSRLDLVVSRIENDRRQNVTLPVTVSGILPRELLPLPTILAHRDIDRQIELYRAGIAVPERGWAGVELVPKRTYEFIVVDRPDELGEILKSTLSVRVGARSVEPRPANSECLAGTLRQSHPAAWFGRVPPPDQGRARLCHARHRRGERRPAERGRGGLRGQPTALGNRLGQTGDGRRLRAGPDA